MHHQLMVFFVANLLQGFTYLSVSFSVVVYLFLKLCYLFVRITVFPFLSFVPNSPRTYNELILSRIRGIYLSLLIVTPIVMYSRLMTSNIIIEVYPSIIPNFCILTTTALTFRSLSSIIHIT